MSDGGSIIPQQASDFSEVIPSTDVLLIYKDTETYTTRGFNYTRLRSDSPSVFITS